MDPTRIDTPPSPAGRRRYKHRNDLCSAHVSWAMDPTRIGIAKKGGRQLALPPRMDDVD